MKMSVPALFCVLLAVALDTPAQGNVSWSNYRSPANDFSVDFPGVPVVRQDAAGRWTQLQVTIDKINTVLLVQRSVVKPLAADQLYSAQVAQSENDNLYLRHRFLRSGDDDGIPGIELLERKQGMAVYLRRLWLVNDQLYTVVVGLADNYEDRPAVEKRFFDSFRLLPDAGKPLAGLSLANALNVQELCKTSSIAFVREICEAVECVKAENRQQPYCIQKRQGWARLIGR